MKKLLLAVIRFYRKHLSKYKLPTQHCIYTPTCSEYGLEAIEKYGALKGGLLRSGEYSDVIRSTGEDTIRYRN